VGRFHITSAEQQVQEIHTITDAETILNQACPAYCRQAVGRQVQHDDFIEN